MEKQHHSIKLIDNGLVMESFYPQLKEGRKHLTFYFTDWDSLIKHLQATKADVETVIKEIREKTAESNAMHVNSGFLPT